MALQPAAGARDLNPHQVELNHEICNQLSNTYSIWGYEEVSPPRVERIDTLVAGGAIDSKEIVRLVADEPLGLRPEMTASIARAACTRLSQKARPLRLWSEGTVFESKRSFDGSILIEEELKSGVELLGIKGIEAEIELLSLLIQSTERLQSCLNNKPKLLIGHTGLMELILKPFANNLKDSIRKALIQFNRLEIDKMKLKEDIKDKLLRIHEYRGKPAETLDQLEKEFGNEKTICDLRRLFKILHNSSNVQNIKIHLDPTFQPHFEFYTGIVFQLIFEGNSSPVVIASGGRYDNLLKRCGALPSDAAGVGFSYNVDKIRELTIIKDKQYINVNSILIAFDNEDKFEKALNKQKELHKEGKTAILELQCCKDKKDAEDKMHIRRCSQLIWI